MSLAEKRCLPCEGEIDKLTPEEAKSLHTQIPEWTLSDDATKLTRRFPFKDFAKALAFANKVGALAEEEWHHPDLKVSWGNVEVLFTTHSIKGLAENDFIMAAKVDALPLD